MKKYLIIDNIYNKETGARGRVILPDYILKDFDVDLDKIKIVIEKYGIDENGETYEIR